MKVVVRVEERTVWSFEVGGKVGSGGLRRFFNKIRVRQHIKYDT